MSTDYGLPTTEKAYLGHDNTVTIVPYSDMSERTNFDMTSVSEVQVSADLTSSTSSGDAVVTNSTDQPDVVFWSQVGSQWRIHIIVGRITGIAAGTYTLEVVITDPSYPNGVVLVDTESNLRVEVVGNP
jgi:hypothetical protein